MGEIQNKCKKIIRDHDGVISVEKREELLKELGDVLWYCAMFAYELDSSLGIVAIQNIEKLSKRKANNKLKGDGDDRE